MNFRVGSLSGYPCLRSGWPHCSMPALPRAGTLTEFPNLPGQTPEDLNGYLARPDTGLAAELGSPSNGGGPFPAVVVLHGCIGITGHFTGIADRLSSWGCVALAVDSLGPHGLADRCGVGILDQAFDAYAALRYLSQLYFVDPARVAVLGNSMWISNRKAVPRFMPPRI